MKKDELITLLTELKKEKKREKKKKKKIGRIKNSDLKAHIKGFSNVVLSNDKKNILGAEFNPKITHTLEAYAVESKSPLGNGEYSTMLMHIVAWGNGEGYDISVSGSKGIVDKMYLMHFSEIELLIKGLDKMGFFKYDEDELKI